MSEQKPLDEGVSAPIKPIIKPKDSKWELIKFN